jgi:hypothetical protein
MALCYLTHDGVKCKGNLFQVPPNIGIPADCLICDRCGAVHTSEFKPWFPPEHPAARAKMNAELEQRLQALEQQNAELLNHLAQQSNPVTPGAAQQPGMGVPVGPVPSVVAPAVKDPVP